MKSTMTTTAKLLQSSTVSSLVNTSPSNINSKPTGREVSTLSGLLAHLPTQKTNSQTPVVRITEKTFEASDLIKKGEKVEGVFSSPTAQAKIAAHAGNIFSGAVMKLNLASNYDQETGEPTASAKPSYADVAISNSLGNLNSGAEVLLVGIHPDQIVDETIGGKKVNLIDSSAVVIGRYRKTLEKAGYVFNAGSGRYEKKFSDGKASAMTSIRLTHGDVNALLKNSAERYDFIGDANAATIYGKDKGIINAYFKNLRDGGTARFSVCDKFDALQHPNAVDIHDLSQHQDKDVTIVAATYAHRLIDKNGKDTQEFTERAFEYESQLTKEKMLTMLQNDTGKPGGLGRLHVLMVKPTDSSLTPTG